MFTHFSSLPHKPTRNISVLFIVPVIATIIPYLAAHFFDSPQLHGVLSADTFFLLLLLLLPEGKILWKIPFVIFAVLYAVSSSSIDAYAVAGVYTLMVFSSAIIPRSKRFVFPVYTAFALLILIADSGNFFYSTFVLTIPDVWGLAKFYWWGIILFFTAPLAVVFLELFFARKILWGKQRIALSHISVYIICSLSLALNFGIYKLQDRQPIMDFSLQKWFWQICTPGIIGQSPFLQADIKENFSIWERESTVIEDYRRPTIMILVESYGINKSIEYTRALLAPFNKSNSKFIGLYLRDAAHTQGAEWEDFLVPGGIISRTPLPQLFKDNGMQSFYIHGYDEKFYERGNNYSNYGFDHLLFKEEMTKQNFASCHYGFDGICDSTIIGLIDSLITDTIPKFIYWTTLDAHPPYEMAKLTKKSSKCASLSLSDVDCTYFSLQETTLQKIAVLASNHPEYRIIIRGDHRPMGSLEQSNFVQSFYFRWVPLVILN